MVADTGSGHEGRRDGLREVDSVQPHRPRRDDLHVVDPHAPVRRRRRAEPHPRGAGRQRRRHCRGKATSLHAAGVVNPAKVERSALENAASIASLLLTTEALVAEKPEKNPPAPAGPPGGMPEY